LDLRLLISRAESQRGGFEMNKEVKRMKYSLLSLVIVVTLLAVFPLTALACHITEWSHNVSCCGFELTGQNDWGSSVYVTWRARIYPEADCGVWNAWDYQYEGGFWASPHSGFTETFNWPDTLADGAYCVKIDAWGGGSPYDYHPDPDYGIIVPCNPPTAVDLASFEAAGAAGNIVLNWETASEIDNLGFNLYRADSADGPRTQLNAGLIPSQNPGSPVGASYQFVDNTASSGATYYYWLETMDVYGQTNLHGPVSTASLLLQRTLIRPRLDAGLTRK
jgi:hypothetical protein